jgi:patatin-like phospholipase/acyl hydrolase
MNQFRVLSIDGGGIKGVFPASVLAGFESALELKSVAEYFDLIAGTSIGGIIAIGLGLGLNARDMVEFFVKKGPSIFPPDQPSAVRLLLGLNRYDPEPLRSALGEAFGTQKLGDSKVRLLIPSFDASKPDIHIYKTAHSKRLMMDYKIPAVEVAMATAAAPTYFPAYDSINHFQLVDGGLWANNPVCMAVVEAITLLQQPPDEVDVLSIGCTQETVDYKAKWHPGFYWLWHGIYAAMRGQSQSALGMARHLTGRDKGAEKILRINPDVAAKRFNLDGVKKIEELQGFGYTEARNNLPYVRERFFSERCEAFVPNHLPT